ncbi:hypothetical protein ACE14D_27245 [Streptomyces sp. Act-28]
MTAARTDEYGNDRWGCGGFVDRPHRSRRYGWEKIGIAGHESGNSKHEARAVANRGRGPRGACHYSTDVGELTVAGGPNGTGTKIRATVRNHGTDYPRGRNEMCVG